METLYSRSFVYNAAVCIVATLGVSCVRRQTVAASTSHVQDAIVTSEQAKKAYNVVESTRNYLPYEYTRDGCYARASYMQMELAKEGIPSRAVYVRAPVDRDSSGNITGWSSDPNIPTLKPENWVYHVAPAIIVDGKEMVLDPSLNKTPGSGGAMTFDEWNTKMGSKNYVEAPADNATDGFTAHRAPNTESGPFSNTTVRGQPISTVEQMEPFSKTSVLSPIGSTGD